MITKVTQEDEKRQEILANCSSNCMVEAGAGAGKTTIIIARIVSQLKKGLIKASELVVITFTKAASGELRDRLSLALTKAFKEESDEEAKANLKDAIDNISLIQVSTIHSFCFRLLKERALDAKLPLDIEMLEEVDNSNRINDFFKKWYKDQNKDDIIAIRKEFYARDFTKYVYDCFKEICDLPDDMRFAIRMDLLNGPKLKDYINKMKEQMDNFIAFVDNIIQTNGLSNNIDSAVEDKTCLSDFVKWYKKYKSAKNNYGIIAAYRALTKKANLADDLYNKDGSISLFCKKYICYNQDIYDYTQNEANIASTLDLYQNALIVSLAIKARNDYQQSLKYGENRHFLSNDQLLKNALTLVKNEDALKHFQKEFKYIYVDEFQDTDTVQRDLVFTLVRKIGSEDFYDSSFFLVGDPKQSIYAFRGADLEVYKDTKDLLEKPYYDNVYVYELARNHRSEETIINWVNKEFSSAVYGLGDIYLAMTPSHKAPPKENILNGVYSLSRPSAKPSFKKGERLKKEELLERESKFLPKFIKAIMKDYKINVFNKDGSIKETRSIDYKDFLVLSKNKDELEVYAKELKNEHIAVNLYGALNLKDDSYILRFKAVLHYLACQTSDFAKYGAMEVLSKNIVCRNNEEKASALLKKLCDDTRGMKAHMQIDYLVHHIEYFIDKKTNSIQLEYVQATYQQLLEYLLSFEVQTLLEYDALLDSYIASGLDKALILEKTDNAVRLMNLHKSKGLEGKIVIVLARFSGKSDSLSSYRKIYDYYPVIKGGKYSSVFPSYNPYKEDDVINPVKANDDEFRRLEYVEATRAEEALIFFDNVCTATKGNAIFAEFDFNDVEDLTKTNLSINKLYKDIMIDGKLDLEESESKLEEIGYTPLEKKKIEDDANGYTIISPSDYEDYSEEWEAEAEDRPVGKVFGIILHRVFELACTCIEEGKPLDASEIINLSMMESYNDLYLSIDEKYFDYNIGKYKSYLHKKLADFLNSDLVLKIKEAKEVYPEYQFNLFLSDDMKKDLYEYIEKGTVYLNGKVDLVLVYDDHIDIYDYKTDHKGNKSISELEKHLEDTYSLQQKLYCLALSFCFGMDLSKIQYHFYHLYE